MIDYIKGELTDLSPAFATIEVAGIGYGLKVGSYLHLRYGIPHLGGYLLVEKHLLPQVVVVIGDMTLIVLGDS